MDKNKFGGIFASVFILVILFFYIALRTGTGSLHLIEYLILTGIVIVILYNLIKTFS